MKIINVQATPVYVEMEAPLRWSMGVVGDVIIEPLTFQQGGLSVPQGPGLGVDLDVDRLRFHAEQYEERGEDVEFFDPQHRPGWMPHLPLW